MRFSPLVGLCFISMLAGCASSPFISIPSNASVSQGAASKDTSTSALRKVTVADLPTKGRFFEPTVRDVEDALLCRAEQRFQVGDRNRDGLWTSAEAKSTGMTASTFGQMDTNGDRYVSYLELGRHDMKTAKETRETIRRYANDTMDWNDKNFDRRLSWNEVRGQVEVTPEVWSTVSPHEILRQAFVYGDQDHDDVLDLGETHWLILYLMANSCQYFPVDDSKN